MKNIIIKTIPSSEQRYITCGDYWRDPDGTLQIRVSDLGNDNYEALVALHELVEVLLTERRGIREEDIMDFDKNYEAHRLEGDESECGDSPLAPYCREHLMATGVEKVVASALDVNWMAYDIAVMNS